MSILQFRNGKINQDRYALKWKSEKKGAKSVKLTSMLTQTYVDAYLCRNCNKIIIDVDSVEE